MIADWIKIFLVAIIPGAFFGWALRNLRLIRGLIWCIVIAEVVPLPLAGYVSWAGFHLTGGRADEVELVRLIHATFYPPIFVSILLGYCLFHFHGKPRGTET
jgi:hypothetical protein